MEEKSCSPRLHYLQSLLFYQLSSVMNNITTVFLKREHLCVEKLVLTALVFVEFYFQNKGTSINIVTAI